MLDAVDDYQPFNLINKADHWWHSSLDREDIITAASGYIYTRWYDEVIQDFPQQVTIVDDTLLYDDDNETAFFHIYDNLNLCAHNVVVFNESRFQFCRDEGTFGGSTITALGATPTSALDAVYNLRSSKSILHSWFGLVNQVAGADSLPPIKQQFHDLLRPEAKFYWDDQFFFWGGGVGVGGWGWGWGGVGVGGGVGGGDISSTTCLGPDRSQTGMGFLLPQKYCHCDTKNALVCFRIVEN